MSVFDNYERKNASSISLDNLKELFKNNKKTFTRVAKTMSQEMLQMQRKGAFKLLKGWWQANLPSIDTKAQGMEEMCRFVVCFSVLADAWQPNGFEIAGQNIILPVMVERLLAKEMIGERPNEDQMVAMEQRIVNKMSQMLKDAMAQHTNAIPPADGRHGDAALGGQQNGIGVIASQIAGPQIVGSQSGIGVNASQIVDGGASGSGASGSGVPIGSTAGVAYGASREWCDLCQ